MRFSAYDFPLQRYRSNTSTLRSAMGFSPQLLHLLPPPQGPPLPHIHFHHARAILKKLPSTPPTSLALIPTSLSTMPFSATPSNLTRPPSSAAIEAADAGPVALYVLRIPFL